MNGSSNVLILRLGDHSCPLIGQQDSFLARQVAPEEVFESNLVADQSPQVQLGRLEVHELLNLGRTFATADEPAQKVDDRLLGGEFDATESVDDALQCLILLPTLDEFWVWFVLELHCEFFAFYLVLVCCLRLRMGRVHHGV